MQAWVVRTPGPLAQHPIELVTRAIPEPGPGQVLVRVRACGVCRTDLHVAEGDLPVHRPGVVPGHEVVAEVVATGPGALRFAPGDRIGVAWLAATCGTCRWCRAGRENLCPRSRYTGWDLDGGYAEYAVAAEAFAYRIPPVFDDAVAAPLLCAGIIGYRALCRANLPPAGRLGLYGFGGSAHLAAQLAIAQGAEVSVFTRGEDAQRFARDLGAVWAGSPRDRPPAPLDSAILFAPAGEFVAYAAAALAPGGTLAVAGIHLSDIPRLTYAEHLFEEKTLTSVTSNTRADGEEFLNLAARLGVGPTITRYRHTEAEQALAALARGNISGAGVLVVD